MKSFESWRFIFFFIKIWSVELLFIILIDPTDEEIVKQMDGVIDSINSETEIFTEKLPISINNYIYK